MRIKRNDIVQVTSGDDRGKSGKVLQLLRSDNKVIVEGVNFVWKHVRKSQQYPQGARIQKEAPLSASNVMLICQNCNKPTRVAMKPLPTGEKVRLCKKCKEVAVVEEKKK